jgi:hypothetical protein
MNAAAYDGNAALVFEVHERWRRSQVGWDIEAMRSCKALDDKFEQFNLSGQHFTSVDELADLWTGLRQGLVLERSEDLETPRIIVDASMAVLTIPLSVMYIRSVSGSIEAPGGNGRPPVVFSEDATTLVYFRSTETYRHDDGRGNPEWRMWRAHYDQIDTGYVASGDDR